MIAKFNEFYSIKMFYASNIEDSEGILLLVSACVRATSFNDGNNF